MAGEAGERRARPGWEWGLLAVILLGALALRVYGLRWGLPGRTDLNPDENTVLGIVARMSWQNLDPGAYFYGGFFYEACVLVRSILGALRPGTGEAGLVLAYRSISALFGTATVAMLYLLLRRVAPAGPAPLLGAAFLAVMPLHVWDSHFAVTVSTTARFTDDTRLQAQRWLQQRVAEGHEVLTVGAEWYLPRPTGPGVSNLLNYGAMPGVVRSQRPAYVVLTSLHYARAYRQRDDNVAMWETVRKGVLPYRLARRFRAEYLNWHFYRKLDPMFEGYFVSPTIEVYQRVD